MLSFAFEGVTSLTDRPLKMISGLGGFLMLASIVALLWMLIAGSRADAAVWLGVSLWFLGGLILLCLGVVGQYVGKIYLETKHRPRYLVREYLHS